MAKRRAVEGGGGGSEFFICFTSRPSSSTSAGGGGGGGGGIRVPSNKSLMSPGRNSAGGPSLSSSLSRRLRNSGSVKGGGQSPMFPKSSTSSAAISVKKKGSGFEAAVEPSSPKVTCIGQVRVKTKKKKKKNAAAAATANINMMTRSASVSTSRREASFRRSRSSAHGGVGVVGACFPRGRNQKWVHQLPVTICEALRAFGSDFSCFLPSSCTGGGGGRSRGCYSFSDGGDKAHKKGRSTTSATTTYPSSSSSSSSCGTVFLRWLMATHESEEDKGREVMRLMVEETEKGKVGFLLGDKTDFQRKIQHEDREEEDDEEDDDDDDDDDDVVVVKVEKKKEMVVEGDEDVEKGRMSVCIPPKNALLLMRCRSDPVRMAALANKFWGSPVIKIQCEKEEEDEEEEEEKFSTQLETNKDGHFYHVNEKKKMAEEEEAEQEKMTNLQSEHVLLKAGEVEEEEVVIDEERLEGVALNKSSIEEGMRSQTEYEKASEEKQNHPQVMDDEERAVAKEEEREMLEGKQAVSTEPPKKEDGHVVEEEEEETMEACDKELRNEAHSVQRQNQEVEGEIKGGRISTSNSSSKGKGGEHHPKAKEVAKRRNCYSNSSKEKKERRRHSFSIERESRRNSFSSEREARRSSFSIDREGRRRWSFSIDKEELQVPKQQHHPLLPSSDVDVEKQQKVDMLLTEEEAVEEIVRPPKMTLGTQNVELTLEEARDDDDDDDVGEKKKTKKKKKKGEEVEKKIDLPECLRLMMYEPKLSMEVSKETWVCSTDFLSWRPNHNPQPQPHQHSSKAHEEGNADNKYMCTERNKEVPAITPGQDSAAVDPPPQTPSSASPIVSAVEPKLSKGCSGAVVLPQAAVPYDVPFVLTRCKSEPLKSSARLAPESCFWKSRHQPIGATGIGF